MFRRFDNLETKEGAINDTLVTYPRQGYSSLVATIYITTISIIYKNYLVVSLRDVSRTVIPKHLNTDANSLDKH